MAKTKAIQRTLTPGQRRALELLQAGQDDSEVAQALGLDVATLAKWRLYDPYFQAAMNRRRSVLQEQASDRLLALLLKAFAVLEEELDGQDRGRLALSLVRYCGVVAAKAGPTEAQVILDGKVQARRDAMPAMERLLMGDRPIDDGERTEALTALERQAGELD